MTGGEEGQGGVPTGPRKPLAVASALVLGAALAASAGRPAPRPPEVERGTAGDPMGDMDSIDMDPIALDSIDMETAPPPGKRVMAAVIAGLRSGDPFERRETAGVVERLAREGDAASRLALAAALSEMGGAEARLPLGLLASDADRRVRVEARRGLLAVEGQ